MHLAVLSLLLAVGAARAADTPPLDFAVPPPPSYVARYGPFFVWHALSVTFAWTLLLPLAHLLSSLRRSPLFPIHRVTMIAVLVLTAQTHILALFFATERAPVQHVFLGTVLLCAVALQATSGALRPDKTPPSVWRRVWARFHRSLGTSCLLFAFYLLHHSCVVFDSPPWMSILINVCVAFGALLFVILLFLRLYALYNASLEKHLESQQQPQQHTNPAEVQILLAG